MLCSSSAFSDQALSIVHTNRHSSLACGWPRSPRFISLPQTRKLADGTEMNTAEPRSLLTASGDAHAKAWVERGRSLHIKRESPKNVNFSRHLFWYGKTYDCAKTWALTPWLRAAPARGGNGSVVRYEYLQHCLCFTSRLFCSLAGSNPHSAVGATRALRQDLAGPAGMLHNRTRSTHSFSHQSLLFSTHPRTLLCSGSLPPRGAQGPHEHLCALLR